MSATVHTAHPELAGDGKPLVSYPLIKMHLVAAAVALFLSMLARLMLLR